MESKHQALRNREIHDWYRFVMAYPDHLVSQIIRVFEIPKGALLLDPFCGTGTTLVECKKQGIESVGIDANPVSVFATRVKTNWHLDVEILKQLSTDVIHKVQGIHEASRQDLNHHKINQFSPYDIQELENDATVRYLRSSGMIKRGWISEPLLLETVLIKRIIIDVVNRKDYRDFLLLGLISIVVGKVANIKFGPEIYCVKPKPIDNILKIYEKKISEMIADLEKVQNIAHNGVLSPVFQGDSRESASILNANGIGHIDFVITSPPYPTEHDYTRNTRLELAYLEYVDDAESVKRIKRSMICSHSKGVYKDDNDGANTKNIQEVQDIVNELREKALSKKYAFAQRYPIVVSNYFGGMYRHLKDISVLVSPGARCAYVLGDQCSYLDTYIPTADIIAKIAQLPDIGFQVDAIESWRKHRGSTGRRDLYEKILFLSKDLTAKYRARVAR